MGQDLGTDVLQSLLLLLEVSLMAVEAGLTGAQGLELSPELDKPRFPNPRLLDQTLEP
jgi:hypothetical protein